MSLHPRVLHVAMGIVGFLVASAAVDASVLSLKAVKKNNVAITPTNNLAVLPNDIIEAEISLNSWANDFPPPTTGVRFYQVTIAGRTGFVSGDNGTILPLGWCAPLDRIDCPTVVCPSAYPNCLPEWGCFCAGHNPSLGVFVMSSRPDWIFNGMLPLIDLCDVDTWTLNYIYFCIAEDGVPYTGVSRYLGTLILKVSANACGTFTVTFDPDRTFIGDAANPANTSLPTFQPLNLTVSNCARQLMSCSPTHCNVDARIAMDPKTGARLNPNTIDMTFSKSTAGMTPADFEVSLLPVVDGDTTPVIQSVTQDLVNPNKTKLVFLPRIAQTRWTCFRDIGSNKRCCMGSLPGDADGNLVSNANDIFKARDNLLGAVNPHLTIEKCDIDRSLQCAPPDLLMIVDLLNGADMFDPPTLNQTLPSLVPACPDMRLLP